MDSALDVVSGEIIDAEQLWLIDVVDKERYVCRGCGVKAIPASYLPTNLVRPYFRATHLCDCDVHGEKKLVQKGKQERLGEGRDSFPAPYPSRLTLSVKRDVVEPDRLSREPREPDGRGTPAGGSPSGKSRKRAAGTIRPICRTFLNFPYNRDLELAIPGIDGATYQQVFRRLKWDAILVYAKNYLFYAPMRWQRPVVNDDYIEIALDSGEREGSKLIRPCRVRVAWEDWSTAKRTYVKTEIEVARKEAIEVSKTSPKIKGYVFFLGDQDVDDPSLFHVTDHRLICCLVDELIKGF